MYYSYYGMYLCSYPSLARGVVMRIGGFLEISEDKRINATGRMTTHASSLLRSSDQQRPPKDPSPLLLWDASYDRLSCRITML